MQKLSIVKLKLVVFSVLALTISPEESISSTCNEFSLRIFLEIGDLGAKLDGHYNNFALNWFKFDSNLYEDAAEFEDLTNCSYAGHQTAAEQGVSIDLVFNLQKIVKMVFDIKFYVWIERPRKILLDRSRIRPKRLQKFATGVMNETKKKICFL